jgi:lipopolysaccharide/colanic/teichoic acid biosynthesis glycosyltransferase
MQALVPPALSGPLGRLVARASRGWTLARRDAMRRLGPPARRVFDVVFSAAALAVAAPIVAVAAAAVKLTSPGPVLLRQVRVGKDGEPFVLFKLRSMYIDAEKRRAELEHLNESRGGVTFKIKRDPRITPVGRILRRLSIDELPQLYNVLRGDMSVFGPRPPLGEEVARYDARARRRLEIKPGLTAIWQISGRSDLSFEEQVALDLAFIDRTTPAGEARILIRTIPAVLSGRGAY